MSASLRGGWWDTTLAVLVSNPHHLSWWETVSGGQFDWGGRLLKGNGGAQRFPQNGWKSFIECKGIRELDCETTSRAGSKDGLSDPVVPHGRAIAQRIKATPGITGLSPQEFTSTGRFGTSMSAHRILGL